MVSYTAQRGVWVSPVYMGVKDFFWGILLRVFLFLFHEIIFQINFGYPETKITDFKISGTRLGTTLHHCRLILETETEPGT